MKIKGVGFPAGLLNALRDERLVVFAGAGVSMGAPANLPSFHCLAKEIAKGTSQHIKSSETEDQLLGRLEDCESKESHQLVTKLLHSNNPVLLAYRSLLHFFHATDPGRITTTNFHCLLEQKAESGGDLRRTRAPLNKSSGGVRMER